MEAFASPFLCSNPGAGFPSYSSSYTAPPPPSITSPRKPKRGSGRQSRQTFHFVDQTPDVSGSLRSPPIEGEAAPPRKEAASRLEGEFCVITGPNEVPTYL